MAVCGRCAAVGDHYAHEIVDTVVKELERKRKVRQKVDQLKGHVLPRVEMARKRVETTNADLTRCADEVRAKIRRAESCAVDTIHAVAELKLQEVDDIETVRHKVLDHQSDELKYQAKRLRAAITLFEKLEATEAADQDAARLLEAIDERAEILANEKIAESPAHHSLLDLQKVDDHDIIRKASTIIGAVMCKCTPVSIGEARSRVNEFSE